MLAGCAGLMDGFVLFDVETLDHGERIFDAHVAAVDAHDILHWGAGVVFDAEGKVMASHSSLVWGSKESSHATSLNGREYIDNTDLFDMDQIDLPEGGPITAPASLGDVSLGALRNIAQEGRITVTFVSACVPQSGPDAGYEVGPSGPKKGSFECQEGDWSAIVVEDPQGAHKGTYHTIILRA